MTENCHDNIEIPNAPSVLDFGKIKETAIKDFPEQVNQIIAALGVAKKAKEGGYEAYQSMCYQLAITPVSVEEWNRKGATESVRPLLVKSLQQNLHLENVSEEEIDALLTASDSPNKREALQRVVQVLLKGILKAGDKTVGSWAGLANAVLAWI